MELEKIAKRYFALKAQEKALQKEIKEVASLFEGLELRKHPAGDFIVTLSKQLRFNGALAKTNLSKPVFDSICVMTPSGDKAREVLKPAQLKKVFKETSLIVKVDRVDDEEN